MNPKGEIQDSEPSSETSSLSPYKHLHTGVSAPILVIL